MTSKWICVAALALASWDMLATVAQDTLSLKAGEGQVIQTRYYPMRLTYPSGMSTQILFQQSTGGLDWKLSCEYSIECENPLFLTNRYSYIQYSADATTWKQLPCGTLRSLVDLPARVSTLKVNIVLQPDSYVAKAIKCFIFAVVDTTSVTTAAPTAGPATTAAPGSISTATATAASTTSSPAGTGCTCGRNPAATDRIVNGAYTTIESHPWQVALIQSVTTSTGSGYQQFCGGTIVNNEWVLTAGHCIDTPPTNLKIMAGTSTLSGESVAGARQIVSVDRIVLHPQYSETNGPVNDIALLHLATPLKFTNYVQPACLPYPDRAPADYPAWNIENAAAQISGWGTTKYGSSSSSPNQVMGAQVKVMGYSQCGAMQPRLASSLDANMICGYNSTTFSDTCQGDSGGPLTVDDAKSCTYIVGVVSYGLGCGDPGYPGVYTKVSNFMSSFVLPTMKSYTPAVTMCYP